MRRLLLVFVTMLGLPCCGAAFAQKAELRVGSYGGAFTATQAKYAGSIYTLKTGAPIEWIDGNPTDQLAKMIASRGRTPPFDVVYLDEYVQTAAIEAKVITKIDPKLIPNLKFIYSQAKQKDGYGPAVNFWSVGIVYNTQIFAKEGIPAPTSWADLVNPRFAGKIALPDITQSAAKDLIIATARLLGGNERNTTGAFAKLAQIKPLYYYQSSADLAAKMLAGDVWITVWNNGQSANLIDKGAPLKFLYPKEGGFGHITTADVVRGTPHPREAQVFINQLLDPLSQLGQANEVPYGPVNKLLAPILAAYPDLAKRFPSSPADLARLYISDPKVVNAQYPNWIDQWNQMVSQ